MMKKILTLFVGLGMSAAFAETYQWDDMNVRKINKEDSHAFFIIADSFESAKTPLSIDDVDKIYTGANYKLLNGKWKFFFAKNADEIKESFVTEKFNDSAWTQIEVPGTWQMQGYDTIHYANVTHEFFYDKKGNWLEEFKANNDEVPAVIKKPFINEIHREAGIYRTTFTTPENWDGKDVFLKFGGVKSGFKLYVNGNFVGYSEDSFLPAEFNVTQFLKPGKNSVALIVYKFTTGSFFEVQDMPHTMGIFRDAVAFARPNAHLRDYYAVAKISEDLKSADFKFQADINNATDGMKLDVFIVDENKQTLTPINAIVKDGRVAASAKLENFKLWSPDKPNLYKIIMRLSDAGGKEIETVWADWAFRKYELRGKETFLNNQYFMFKGTNRHNYSPDKGSTVDFDLMKRDAELIKQANINSIRTSHYPNDEKFYMLCNRYGLTVIDENNHETHDLRKYLPAEDDKFVAPSVERMENMVYRDRNVPSVLVWSLGNESATYHSKSHKAMEDAARKIDPTRPIHSEPGAGDKNNTSDFVSPMYGGIGRMQQYLNSGSEKPFIFCEYSFGIGNGIGNLKDVWDMIRREPSLCGGFLWDWADRTLLIKRADGKTILADGRDFGTRPHAGTWCASGIVFGDRTLPPKYFEVQRVYQDIQMEAVDAQNGVIKFANEFVDTNLNEFDLQIIVERNGIEIARSLASAPNLPAGAAKEIALSLPKFDKTPHGEYFYTVNILRREKNLFAEAKSIAASAQFAIGKTDKALEIASRGNVAVSEKGDTVTLSASGAVAVFDKNSANLVSLSVHGEKFITSPVEFDISSAWVDNHGRFKNEANSNELNKLQAIDKSLAVKKQASSVSVITSATLVNTDRDGFVVDTVYTMLGNGAMQVNTRVTKLNDIGENILLPRVGARMGLNKSFADVTYFGRGAMHNYNDKLQAAPVGLYKMDVAKEVVRYVNPQDSGNREDIRWMKILNSAGNGAAIIAETPRPMSLLPYTQKILQDTNKPEDLPESVENELRIAWKVAGVGNGALGPITLEKYQPRFKGSVDFDFIILPIKNAKEYFDFTALKFPQKLSHKFEKFDENLKNEKIKPIPAGKWISKNAKATYSSRSQYSPKRETVLEVAGENYGFHTDRNDAQQWMIIDLEKSQNLTGAMIYNRKDAQADRTNNMIMFVSEDGNSWREVWRTREAKPMWYVNFDKPANARYVKLLLDKKEYFHLSGVKIYAE